MPAGWGLCGPDVEVKGDCDAWGHMWLRPGDLRLTTALVRRARSSDEGKALAQQLRDLGVEVQHVPHSGLWSTASSGSTMSLRRQPRPAVIFLIGSATSFAAVQLCRPTERAPLNDPAAGRATQNYAGTMRMCT
jgi:hypothetical protein